MGMRTSNTESTATPPLTAGENLHFSSVSKTIWFNLGSGVALVSVTVAVPSWDTLKRAVASVWKASSRRSSGIFGTGA